MITEALSFDGADESVAAALGAGEEAGAAGAAGAAGCVKAVYARFPMATNSVSPLFGSAQRTRVVSGK